VGKGKKPSMKKLSLETDFWHKCKNKKCRGGNYLSNDTSGKINNIIINEIIDGKTSVSALRPKKWPLLRN
jgi:hypothetical protein